MKSCCVTKKRIGTGKIMRVAVSHRGAGFGTVCGVVEMVPPVLLGVEDGGVKQMMHSGVTHLNLSPVRVPRRLKSRLEST